jgi:class 3 adenylate cyclase/tetratricopeptide (TPR) repeat protein
MARPRPGVRLGPGGDRGPSPEGAAYTRLVVTCPSCREENPDRAKFCLNCATPLQRVSVAEREERKVVTVLFCDLVGFTERSDQADPEDVKATLRPYHARLKREIEAHGGTLDKFVGDAALGVFGSPAAHEDDPERAVRTAFAIREAIDELNAAHPSLDLAVRIAINSGEAVVAYGRGPQVGEAVTGDVVNPAARLQAVAPPNQVVVGEPTYRATRQVFVYEAMEAVRVKGKAAPLSIWLAKRSRARIGADVGRDRGTPFVGREKERRTLRDLFERAARDRAVQLVTIVGEPGVGKSRLAAELGAHVDELSDLVVWRQGRCLSYGEAITFWPLGEIVKAHAGILESDSPGDARRKLDAVIPETEPDREWLLQRLAPLIGVEGASGVERDESFTAWRRFLELVASVQPAVFLLEDLHWADAALLEFVEHVAERSEGVAMVLVCTARHELFEQHPAWTKDMPNATTIRLRPLSVAETSQLIAALLERASLSEEMQSLILDRAGGNPLYAEEFVRMLRDRDLLVQEGRGPGVATGADVPFPESIQALIAARLDTLAPDKKALLQDASVIGKVFWLGAVAAIGRLEESDVRVGLDELVRKELVQASRDSTIEGQAQYAYWHGLIRDVAYSQIPRAARAEKHRAAAAWIEDMAMDRVDDQAEILAHHYLQALSLSRAANREEDAAELEGRARRFLMLAGDRSLGLDVALAESHYARALDLTPPAHHERPAILARWADAVRQAGRPGEAVRALEEAITTFRERGERRAAARALRTLSSVLLTLGDARQEHAAADAVALLEQEAPSAGLVAAYAQMAGVNIMLGRHREIVEWTDRAIALARRIDCDIPPRTLGFRGYARAALGDREGIADMRQALSQMIERGEGRDGAVLYNNLAVAALPVEGPTSAEAVLEEGIEFAERRGVTEMAQAMKVASLDVLADLGKWDQAIELADRLEPVAQESGAGADLIQIRWGRTRVYAARGQLAEAAGLADWIVEAARASEAAEDFLGAFVPAASVYLGLGYRGRARALLAEVEATPGIPETPTYPSALPEMIRTAVAAGDVDLAERLATGMDPVYAYREHAARAAEAILAEAHGTIELAAQLHMEAAERWERFGVVPERGHALLGAGRCLLELGAEGAEAALRNATAIFAELRAGPSHEEAVKRLDRLVSQTSRS